MMVSLSLSLCFSNKHLYAQCTRGNDVLIFMSTNSKRYRFFFKNTSVKNCFILGQELGYSFLKKSITKVVVNRKRKYHGRLKAFIEGMRFFLKI